MASPYGTSVIPPSPAFRVSSSDNLNNLYLPAHPATVPSNNPGPVMADSDLNIFQQPTPERTPPRDSSRRAAKLEARKLHRASNLAALPKGKNSSMTVEADLVPYHQYRARQRRDAGADGESIWDEDLEAAFMQGKANIDAFKSSSYRRAC